MKEYAEEVKVIFVWGFDFEERVNALLADGWSLHGPPKVITETVQGIAATYPRIKIVQVLKRWKLIDMPESSEENPYASPNLPRDTQKDGDDGTQE